jgi:hypothetical protein
MVLEADGRLGLPVALAPLSSLTHRGDRQDLGRLGRIDHPLVADAERRISTSELFTAWA